MINDDTNKTGIFLKSNVAAAPAFALLTKF